MGTFFFSRPWQGWTGLPEDIPTSPNIIYGDTPSIEIVNEFEARVVRVVAWADIYEADNITPWRTRVAVEEGNVTVDMGRSERRNLDITFNDADGALGYGPEAFWYDKIIKPYRGITLASGDEWVSQLGEFYPDNIERPHFPSVIRATCRDQTKKVIADKFPDTTTFAAGLNVGTVISTIATNAGITKKNFVTTTSVLAVDTTFTRGDDSRWKAMEDLARAINFEIFFDARGYLVFRPNVDPLTAPLSYTFRTGVDSNLADFTRSTTDTLMFNDVLVYGDGPNNPLVYGRAENTNPASPTRIAKVGRRSYPFKSQFVEDNAKANQIAASLLSVMGLEQYDMNLTSIVVPWLEAGDAVEALLDDAAIGDPTRFLLSNFSIPLGLGTMDGTAKRVTLVG
jgi:hypothetical protein